MEEYHVKQKSAGKWIFSVDAIWTVEMDDKGYGSSVSNSPFI